MDEIILEEVREYCEGYPVSISCNDDNKRLILVAANEGGHNSTQVDLLDLLTWIKKNKPELL